MCTCVAVYLAFCRLVHLWSCHDVFLFVRLSAFLPVLSSGCVSADVRRVCLPGVCRLHIFFFFAQAAPFLELVADAAELAADAPVQRLVGLVRFLEALSTIDKLILRVMPMKAQHGHMQNTLICGWDIRNLTRPNDRDLTTSAERRIARMIG